MFGHFKYNVMPFGLMNAPIIFQNMMNDIFKEFLNNFTIIYIHDILIFSKNLRSINNMYVLSTINFGKSCCM